MRSETRLDSVVFQLTPTRTRFDLVIISNNKKEKLASGLLNPFLAHLKTAQDQIAKGGYSIILEPDPQVGAAWFTKVTVERFVRFVSQPEVLERVPTIESEILQIENAIAIQGNDNFGLRTVADQLIKPVESTRGMKTSVDIDAEKAIVLFKPGSQPNLPEPNGSITQENSKVQLLRVLETRKMILRKEQGMAFARAEAAGFDMDKLVDLISFAECFGASRLKEACIGLRELWKKKHDTGQWLEVEAAAAMSIQPEFSTLNASGIVFAVEAMTQKDFVDPLPLSGGDMVLDIDGKSDKHLPEDVQVSVGHQEHFHGQFQHPTYPQWPLPPPPGHPGFQSYTVQGMPCYQNYPGNIPYFHSPYHSADDPRFNSSHRKGSKRQSVDDKHSDTRGRSTRSHDDTDQNTSDSHKDGSHGHKSHRRLVKSGKKKSNMAVSPSLNDIRSKKHGVGQSESESQSTSEAEDDVQSDMQESKHKHFAETSEKVVRQIKTAQYSDAYSNDKAADGGETDSGNWQAFQKFLLRAEEKSRRVEESMLAGGKDPPRRNQIRDEADMTCRSEYGNSCDRTMGFDLANGKATRMKQEAFEDPLLVSHNGRVSVDRHFKEIENKGVSRRMSNDEFMVYGKEKQFDSTRYSGPYTDHAYAHDAIALKNSLNDIPDESFVLPHRSVSQDIGSDITAIHMDSEFSLSLSKAQKSSKNIKSKISYEPEDVSLVKRGREMVSIRRHLATDFNFGNPVRNSVKLQVPNPENPSINPKVKKLDRDNFKASKDSVEQMRKDALLKKRSSSSRLNPSTEAQKRAEKLRSYKADLQKVKREREEEERKRLEALKRERQKRIAARSNAPATKLPLTAQQTKPRSLTKTLPNPYKSSKFSDSDPPNSSLLHKFPIRTSSNGANVSQKATKPSRLNGSKHGITRSMSSLPVSRKQGVMAEAKADSLRMKRLSDPKSSYNQHPSLVKSVAANRFHKQSLPDESQKKITAIMQLDKRKSATLPELKLQTPKTSDRIGKESTSKGSMEKATGTKPSQTFRCSKEKLSSDNQLSNSDGNLVIEKTVVMLENNVVTALVAHQGGKMLDRERSHGDESDQRCAVVHPPSSSFVIAKLEGAGKLDGKLSSSEVVSHSRNEPQKFSKLTELKKSYQAPSARGTSLNDPVGTHLGYGRKTVQESATSFEKLTLGNHLETHEEPVSPEKKGFRKLLKFGRKRHNLVGESTDGSDISSVDEQTVATGSLNAGNLLKNLISQDGNHAGSTPSKVSRSFSLLSPFRSKSSYKNQAES